MSTKTPGAPASIANVQFPWALFGTMAVWGLNMAAVKQLTASFDPQCIAALRMAVAAIALTVMVMWRKCGMPPCSGKQWAAVFACALLMVYLNQILLAEGLVYSTAANGALIMALSPLVSSLLAALVFRERLPWSRLVGVALGFSGVAAVVLSHADTAAPRAMLGDAMLAGSMLSFAAGGVIVQRLAQKLHPLLISWAIYCIGAVMLAAHARVSLTGIAVPLLFPGLRPWALVLFSGVFATAIGNLVWNRAIATIGVARTALFLYWVPIFGVAFAVLLLGERLTPWHLAGFVLVFAGTYFGSRQSSVLTHS